MKRLPDNPGNVFRVLHQVMVLGDCAGDLDHRCLLKRIGADDVPGHLAGDGDQRNRIHLGVSQSRDKIERSRPRSRHDYAGLARGAGVSLGGEYAPLFVAGQDRANPVLVARESLVQGHARTPRIGKHDIDAMARQRFDQNVCSGNGFRRGFGQSLHDHR